MPSLARKIPVLVVVLASTVAVEARADDVHLDSRTSFQAYEVRSPGTAVLMTRRRLVSSLGLSWMRRLGAAPLAERRDRRPRLSATVRLRLDQDFGETCLLGRDVCVRATNASDPGVYQPLATNTELDAPEVWVRAANPGWEIKAGRQLRLEPVGPARLDGASARVAPSAWLSAEAYGGAQVRVTSLAGSGAFEPQGATRLDLSGEARARAPFVDAPTTTWLVGGAVSVGQARIVRGRVSFRETFEDAGLVARRGALELGTEPVDELHILGATVWDLHQGELVDAVGTLTVDPVEVLTLAATVERHLPRFDYGTVWAYFDLAPVSDAALRATWRPTRRLELGGGVRGRQADLPGGDEHDAGGEGHVRVRLGRLRAGAALFVWGGDLGPVAGAMLDASHPIGRRLRVSARLSAWHFDDPLRAGLYGTSLSDVVGLEYELSDATRLMFEAEHAYSRVVGHRVRGLAMLLIEVWR